MNDLISRQAAIDAIEHITSSMSVCVNTDECHGMKRMQRQAVIELANLPSAQPGITLESAIDYLHSIGWMQEHDRTLTESAQPERKKGEWNERKVFDTKGSGIEEMQSAKCSVCGKYHTTPYLYFFDNFNFCPNCGADMRGKN